MDLLVPQGFRAGRSRLRRHRPRRLRRVSDDRPGRGAAAPADHAPLHRGEVLRLVDEHVRVGVVLDPVGRRLPAAGAGELALGRGRHLLHGGVDRAERVLVEVELHLAGERRVAEQVAQLVEQRHVVDAEVVAPRLRHQPRRLVVEHALGDPVEQLGVAQPAEHGRRVEHRPPLARELEERVVAAQRVDEVLLGALARPLAAHLAPQRVGQRRGHPGGGAVAAGLGEQLPTDRGQLAGAEVEHVVAVEVAELRGGAGHRLARRTPEHLGHPPRALDLGDRRVVAPGGADTVDHLAERAQRDRGLAEGRQHPLDVAHEDARRARPRARRRSRSGGGRRTAGRRRGAARPPSCRCPGRPRS